MNELEQRLRRELPELAEALVPTPVDHDRREGAPAGPALLERADGRPRPDRSRRVAIGLAAAGVLLLVGALAVVGRPGGDDAPVASPTSFGEWRAVPDAPIAPRPYAVSAWTGTAAVFWAGSSLERGFAHTDGAAFDPSTDTWRTIPVPGWGHPGLTAAFFGGELYALAKGGGTRFDPLDGTWADLPQVEGMFLAATVATDDAVWGLGPAATNPSGQPDLAIARYEPATDTWAYGPLAEGTDGTTAIVAGLSRLESQVAWTGDEIVVWHGIDGGLAFDPDRERWRTIDPPSTESGTPVDGVLAVTDTGPVVAGTVDLVDGRSVWDVAVRVDGAWDWLGSRIPVDDPESVTVAAAGDWLVLLSTTQDPVTVHVATGQWNRHVDAPLTGVVAPNTVWTGEELVVWGGARVDAASEAPTGAAWTPPG